MLGQHGVLVTLYRGLQLVLNKTARIGDTEHHIWCTKGLTQPLQVAPGLHLLVTYWPPNLAK